MKRTILLLAILWVYICTVSAQQAVSETKYDWSGLATGIVGESTEKYEQAYKIYRWLCDHIAYDTSYSIYTADACYENKKGVCQAYSEMFYRLGEAIGLKVDIVSGKSKDTDGYVSPDGHAWVFVYTKENVGILVDPTWGAGSVNNGRFTRSREDDSWFHVDPSWMIFTHFPDDENYQLLDQPIGYSTFASLPAYKPAYKLFGQDGARLLEQCLEGRKPSLPQYYPSNLAFVKVGNLPTEGVLQVGRYYTFIVEKKHDVELMIHNGDSYHKEWIHHEGYDGCKYMPGEGGELTVSIKTPGSEEWSVLAKYEVAPPTAGQIAALEAAEPHRSPTLLSLDNYDASVWMERGVDFAGLLAQVKEEGIKSLPHIYGQEGYTIHSIPLNEYLQRGQSYTFTILPEIGGDWAVINEDDWYQEWVKDPSTGLYTITVVPQKAGSLKIVVRTQGKNTYSFCIEYEVR